MKSFDVPILIIAWRRPDCLHKLFDTIELIQPSKLYFACDGPRAGFPEEAELVNKVRDVFSQRISWTCDVRKLQSDRNYGCRQGVLRAIDWFFDFESEGIILEDDIIPSTSFFYYCSSLLELYRLDSRVWQICGYNRLENWLSYGSPSYFFSNYGPIWGWASWRRAWKLHRDDFDWLSYMSVPDNLLSMYPISRYEREAKLRIAGRLQRRELDTWDYQWGFTKTANSGLSILPSVNLIKNVGFSSSATHTTQLPRSSQPSLGHLQFPLTHPQFVQADHKFDTLYAASAFPSRSVLSRLYNFTRQRSGL